MRRDRRKSGHLRSSVALSAPLTPCDACEGGKMPSDKTTVRGDSCFSGAARRIRKALSRICRRNSPRCHVCARVQCHCRPISLSDSIFVPELDDASLFQSESYIYDSDPYMVRNSDFFSYKYKPCEGDSRGPKFTPKNICKNYSVPNTTHLSGPGWSRGDSGRVTCSHSMPSLSQTTSTKKTRAESFPDMLLKNIYYEEFKPHITADETYRFQCSSPGLYQCSVTGLGFHMGGQGDVEYRTVPWNRRLLTQHHKKPAGPLFDIKCVQQSVRQLHLPHCEIRSTDGGDFLSVAHVTDEDIEFVSPHKITETHVVVNITGFSGFGNVKDEDSPAHPVRALVLLFYRPPADPEPESLLNVLLLPKNVVLRDVLRTRKKLVGDESYIETSPHCKLHPENEYTLSTCPEDDSYLIQPTEAEFDCDNYDNFFPSFQVTWETILKHIKLVLRGANSSHSVWERQVRLLSTERRKTNILNRPANERLFDIRSSFIDGISGPVLKSLLDKLFEKTVMSDSERETADEMQNKRDKARFVIDTVRKKGEAASSEMIEFLCEADSFLCEHLGLI